MQNLMEISFDYYKVFYEVARSHSITLAASHLCLTQPTVTKYIKNLEAVLNCQLFLRSQKGVSLTSEGQRLYRQISHPCQQMGQAQEVIREYVTNQDGRITISATELTMRYFLLPFMERFQHCFPNVKLQIHAHSFPTAITSLREETSDFALSITPLDNCYDFEVTQVSDFQDILIAGSRYSYLENRILSMEEILTYPIISMETGTASRRFGDTLLEEQGYVCRDGMIYRYDKTIAEKLEQERNAFLEKRYDNHGTNVNCFEMNVAVEQLNVDLLYFAVLEKECNKLEEYDEKVKELLAPLKECGPYIIWDDLDRSIQIAKNIPKSFCEKDLELIWQCVKEVDERVLVEANKLENER